MLLLVGANLDKIEILLKIMLLLVGMILLPVFLFYGELLFELYIGFGRPDLTYKGDKTVPEEDVIRYEKITFRDLRLDECTTYDGDTLFFKYYIVKKNRFSKRRLKKLLSQYCNEQYNKCNSYDIMAFHFYRECGTMPWFWNTHGYFPDLESNSDCKIGVFWISKDGIEFGSGY